MDNVFDDIQDVRRLKLDPGDILLVSLPQHTRPEAFGQITERIREKIPVDVEVVVVTGDVQMAVLTRGQSKVAEPLDPAAVHKAYRRRMRELGERV